MNKVFENENGDGAGETSCHESETDKEDDSCFPGDTVAGV